MDTPEQREFNLGLWERLKEEQRLEGEQSRRRAEARSHSEREAAAVRQQLGFDLARQVREDLARRHFDWNHPFEGALGWVIRRLGGASALSLGVGLLFGLAALYARRPVPWVVLFGGALSAAAYLAWRHHRSGQP